MRETCHQTFEQMVLRVRRNLAPHLKALMGPWVVAQCDVYPPAASAAKTAFQAAFPPAKQTEAVAFCKDEIIKVRSASKNHTELKEIHCPVKLRVLLPKF